MEDKLIELQKALKELLKESYKGKHQHSNPNMREAMENAETVLIKLKDNDN
jgi:hypothetical protein